MKANPKKKQRINIVTLGCSKNLWDSEVLLGQLRANLQKAVHQATAHSTDTMVVNTCGFIENAKQESIDTILEYAEAKKQGHIKHLVVMGCLSQRYRDELRAEIPEVDAFYGSGQMKEILAHFGADYKHELLGERQLTTPSHYAYFKISEGCDRPCSFCAIPLMRGKHHSYPIDELKGQAKALAARGTKELVLIAQDLTYYGLDIYGKRELANLLEVLSEVRGIEWIRLQYAYPSKFPMDVLDIMQQRDNICKYLDMPLQHASDPMLKAMRRGITARRTHELLDAIRQKVPEIRFRTTMMVGHPGETADDHDTLLRFIEDQQFDRLGVFTYSHEEDTHSYTLEDNVPMEVKNMRADQVMELQRDISFRKNREMIGHELKVMIDRVEGGYFIGRTEADSPEVDNEVLIDASVDYARIGDFCRIRVTDAMEYDLFGRIMK